MHQSNIFGNGGYALHANVVKDPLTVIDASGNWWGTADPDSIAAAIFDHSDDARCPTVIFEPYQTDSLILSTQTDVDGEGDPRLPTRVSLRQNYPNPFNAESRIGFALPVAGEVRLDVFNVLGRRVRTLLRRRLAAGEHEVVFDGTDASGAQLATGVYLYRVWTPSAQATRKMILVK